MITRRSVGEYLANVSLSLIMRDSSLGQLNWEGECAFIHSLMNGNLWLIVMDHGVVTC